MKSILRALAPLSLAAIIAGCGGGGSSHSVPAPAPASSAAALQSTAVSVTAGSATDVTRLGVTVSGTSASQEQSIAVVRGTTTSANLMLPSGSQVLSIKSYGSKTTQSTLRVTVSSSRLALAVGTGVAQVSLDLAAAGLAGGASGSTTLYVTARDASGNNIVGDLGTSISLTSNDTTGSTTITPATVTTGGATVAVAYNGSGNVGSVTFSATVPGLSANAFTSATLSFTSAQVMYVGNASSLLVFPANATGDPAPLQHIVFSPTQNTVGTVAADASGNLWVLLFGSGVAIIPNTSNGIVTSPQMLPSSTWPAGQVPFDLGSDGAGNVYLLTVSFSTSAMAVTVFPSGSTTPVRQITGLDTTLGVTVVNGLTVASDGTFALTVVDPTYQYGEVAVFAAGASGTAAASRIITGPTTTLNAYGVELGAAIAAFAPDGSIVFNDIAPTGVGAIDVFAPGASGDAAPVRRITGNATGLDAKQIYNLSTGQVSQTGPGRIQSLDGFGVDSKGRIFISELGSQSGVTSQIARFDPPATGNVAPNAVLGGVLTGIVNPGYTRFSTVAVAPPPPTAPSIAGDFLALAPNRGWNYTMQGPPIGFQASPPPPFTMTLYADPTAVNGDTQLVAFQANGVQSDATSGAVVASATFNNGASAYTADSFLAVSNGLGSLPIPGGMTIVPKSLTLGQTFVPYAGITGSVVAIGPVAGSSACPGGAATGATIQYSFGNASETLTYVPGCGITSFVSDNGSVATLTSVSSYPNLGQLAHARVAASADRLQSLHTLWHNIFTPWSAK